MGAVAAPAGSKEACIVCIIAGCSRLIGAKGGSRDEPRQSRPLEERVAEAVEAALATSNSSKRWNAPLTRKTRRRYERQGVLVEPQALHDAEREITAEGRGKSRAS